MKTPAQDPAHGRNEAAPLPALAEKHFGVPHSATPEEVAAAMNAVSDETIRRTYAEKVENIVDLTDEELEIRYGSKLEPFILYDRDDAPITLKDGSTSWCFRRDARGQFVQHAQEAGKDVYIRVSLFVVMRPDGTLLLPKRGAMRPSNPGKFEMSGGHVRAGQPYDATCLRELEEEMKLKPVAAPEAFYKFRAISERQGDAALGVHVACYAVTIAEDARPDVSVKPGKEQEIESVETVRPADVLSIVAKDVATLERGVDRKDPAVKMPPMHGYAYLYFLHGRSADAAFRKAAAELMARYRALPKDSFPVENAPIPEAE